MQEMVIYGVSFDMVGKQPIVLLKTVDGNKFLPIWIGHPEAASILMKLQGAGTPRPMTHDLLCDILGELDVKCTQVSVTELRENTFFASITLSVAGRELEIDSRPERRDRAGRPLRRPDLRGRGGHLRVGDRVRARRRGVRGRGREVQGVPRPGLARGLRRRRQLTRRASGASCGVLGRLRAKYATLPASLNNCCMPAACPAHARPRVARARSRLPVLARAARPRAGARRAPRSRSRRRRRPAAAGSSRSCRARRCSPAPTGPPPSRSSIRSTRATPRQPSSS